MRATARGKSIAVTGWDHGAEGWPDTLHLDKPQVQILYALAEADEVALSYKGLYEVLRGSPATRFSRDDPLSAEQRARVEAYLTPLYDLRLVEQHPDGERPQLTTTGLEVITWLTRRWQGWPEYSEEAGLFHF